MRLASLLVETYTKSPVNECACANVQLPIRAKMLRTKNCQKISVNICPKRRLKIDEGSMFVIVEVK